MAIHASKNSQLHQNLPFRFQNKPPPPPPTFNFQTQTFKLAPPSQSQASSDSALPQPQKLAQELDQSPAQSPPKVRCTYRSPHDQSYRPYAAKLAQAKPTVNVQKLWKGLKIQNIAPPTLASPENKIYS